MLFPNINWSKGWQGQVHQLADSDCDQQSVQETITLQVLRLRVFFLSFDFFPILSRSNEVALLRIKCNFLTWSHRLIACVS